MKTFKEIEDAFNADYKAMLARVAADSERSGTITIDGFEYRVRWGAEMDVIDHYLGTFVTVEGDDPTERRMRARGAEHHAKLDVFAVVANKHLADWRNGLASFPETVEELSDVGVPKSPDSTEERS